MHYPDEEKPLQQPTIIPAPEAANVPIWPPPPRDRAPQGPSKLTSIITIILAIVLIFSGLSLLVYSTTTQYSRALGAQDGSDATAAVRNRLNSQATFASQQRATAIPLQTADSHIYATATAQAAPAATASAAGVQDTATTQAMAALLEKSSSGTPALDDPLSGNDLGYSWDVGYIDNNNTGCNFVIGGYQVLEALPTFLRPCFADATHFSNFTYQVSMTFNSDCAGGLILRAGKSANKYYLFTVNANGSYMFEIYNGGNHTLLVSGTSAAILGVGQANTLAVIADQGVFDLFINQTYVATAISGQLSAGQVGVAVYNTSLPASATFSDAKVWKI